jgi:hypothetical protein
LRNTSMCASFRQDRRVRRFRPRSSLPAYLSAYPRKYITASLAWLEIRRKILRKAYQARVQQNCGWGRTTPGGVPRASRARLAALVVHGRLQSIGAEHTRASLPRLVHRAPCLSQ